MKHLSIDIETYSSVDIKSGGAYRYAQSPDFEILLFAYSVDFGPVEVVDLTAQGDAIPDNIISALSDAEVIKHAYNAAFEWWCLSQYGIETPIEQWRCTMLHALYLGYPAGLKMTGKVLGLSEEELKSSTGTLLINYFCKPCKPTKANGGKTRNHPRDTAKSAEKWKQFIEYNRQDVAAEIAIYQKLAIFPIPDYVQDGWVTDVKMNALGMKIDREVVGGALEVSERETNRLIGKMRFITELENPNSNTQLMIWLQKRGVSMPNLQKATVASMLQTDIPDDVRQVLELKQETAKTSVKKYVSMDVAAGEDDKVRGLLQFYGANRTGRWAGRLVQVQNLPRVYLDDGMLDLARDLVKERNADALKLIYGSIPDTLSQLIRTAFIPEGNKFIVADFSAIEARVIAWLAGEKWRQEAFRDGKDIYCASASQMFGVPVEKHGVNGELRQTGKVAELALGYQGWTGAMLKFGALEKGLREEELPGIILAWREASPNIVSMWKEYENAALYAARTKGECMTHWVTFRHETDPIYGTNYMTIELPSGRKLFYPGPHIDINAKGKEAVFYKGLDNHQWADRSLYGGVITENITQAIARDCLQETINRIEGISSTCDIVTHVHDEVICDYSGDCPEEMYGKLIEIMREPISWAPGLTLDADGFISEYYKKD